MIILLILVMARNPRRKQGNGTISELDHPEDVEDHEDRGGSDLGIHRREWKGNYQD